jgi:hypothetical protein
MRFVPGLIFAIFAVAGCKGGETYAPVPKSIALTPVALKPGEEARLFPIQVGNKWVYGLETALIAKGQRGSGGGELVHIVTDVQDKPDGKLAMIEESVDGKLSGRQTWLVNRQGIYLVGSSQGEAPIRAFDTPQPVILFPPDRGKTFSWKGTSGALHLDLKGDIAGPEEVDTLERRFATIKVHSTTTETKGKVTGKSETISWFAPGVGLVRLKEISASGTTASQIFLRLKSHTVK